MKTNRRVYVFGNPLVTGDSSAVSLITALQTAFPEWIFVHQDPTDEFAPRDKHLICIDTVKGLKRVRVFRTLHAFCLIRSTTVHDYDLSTQLGLLLKLGKISSVIIIGIPPDIQVKKTVSEVAEILTSIPQ